MGTTKKPSPKKRARNICCNNKKQIEDQPQWQLCDLFYDEIVYDDLRDRLGDKLLGQLDEQLGWQLRGELGVQIWGQIYRELEDLDGVEDES